MDKDLHTVVDELFDKIERLQAENEELKNDILNGVMCITCPDKNENCRLQAENDILRQYKNSKQASYENMQRCWQESEKARRKLEKENAELKAKNERLKAEFKRLKESECKICKYFNIDDKYKQTLQEIREITREQLQDVSDRCINTTPMYIVHKQIIDKINEVIGAE